MEEKAIPQRSGTTPGEFPAWAWLSAALLFVTFFMVMSASGDLLVPYAGEISAATDYLHELAHDGRHILGVPCH